MGAWIHAEPIVVVDTTMKTTMSMTMTLVTRIICGNSKTNTNTLLDIKFW